MSDLANKPKPNYAPVYAAAMYPDLAQITRDHGYALAVHGSVARDFDLIAIPWVENPAAPEAVIEAIVKRFAVKVIRDDAPVEKPHGRRVWVLSVGFGECFLDLGFMPTRVSA